MIHFFHIILFLTYTGIFIFLIRKLPFFRLNGISSTQLNLIFGVKIIAGSALLALYTYYYQDRKNSDIYKYYHDAQILYNLIGRNPKLALSFIFGVETAELKPYLEHSWHYFREYNFGLFNDNRTMIRFNFISLYFSDGFILIHTLFINFLSFIGLVALYKTIQTELKLKVFPTAIAVFLIPSVLFWGSGILKEGFLIFAMGIFIYQLFRLYHHFNLNNTLKTAVALLLLSIIKPYVLISILPALSCLLLIKLFKFKVISTFISVHLLGFLTMIVLRMTKVFDIFDLMQQKQTAFYNVAKMSNASSVYSLPTIESPLNAILSIPIVLFNVFFRPSVLDIDSILYILPALENSLLLIVIILVIIYYKRPHSNQYHFIAFAISFCFILALIVGWTTPVFGSLIRYKIPILPFLLAILFHLIDFDKINQKFNLSIR